jgi:7-cyano-7-deazaguanine synthase
MSTVISLSGGLDSSTLLSMTLKSTQRILCVNFYYGSKHGIMEGLAAERIAEYYKVPLMKLDLSELFTEQRKFCALMKKGPDVPEGHYNDESMKMTVVPGRNTIFTAILAGIAESMHYDKIALAIHQGDHYIYPDCRPEWLIAMSDVIAKSTEGRVCLEAPFIYSTKKEIVAYGLKCETPYGLTYTCYKGQAKPCGVCGSCRERSEAFTLNGAIDPCENTH